jgi:hypothetical protein
MGIVTHTIKTTPWLVRSTKNKDSLFGCHNNHWGTVSVLTNSNYLAAKTSEGL